MQHLAVLRKEHVVLDDRAGRELLVRLPDLARHLGDLGAVPLNIVLDVRLEVLQLDLAVLVQGVQHNFLSVSFHAGD